MNTKFPGKYKKALFASDWSFGIIYAVYLKPNGSSYTAEAEEFLSGAPLPLTDGIIGPDGALYFLTGGRGLESDLYRVYYNKDDKQNAEDVSASKADEGQQVRDLRKQLEAFHGKPQKDAIDFAWPYLKHGDRFIRYAARMVLEHQPVSQWQVRAMNEKDPQALTQAMIALARHGKPGSRNAMLKSLMAVNYTALSETQQIDLIRAFELIVLRMGMPEPSIKAQVVAYLNPHYPASSNSVNRSLSKVLVYLEGPGVVEKTLALLETAKDDASEKTASQSSDLILRNPEYGMNIANMLSKIPPAQQMYYATYAKRRKKPYRLTRKMRKTLLGLTERLQQKVQEKLDVYAPQAGPVELLPVYERLRLIKQVITQQRYLLAHKDSKLSDRILSLHKPYVRAIVRGKEIKAVEFGAKAHVVQVDGINFIEHLSYKAFNDTTRLG